MLVLVAVAPILNGIDDGGVLRRIDPDKGEPLAEDFGVVLGDIDVELAVQINRLPGRKSVRSKVDALAGEERRTVGLASRPGDAGAPGPKVMKGISLRLRALKIGPQLASGGFHAGPCDPKEFVIESSVA